jgi:hypothetical protein
MAGQRPLTWDRIAIAACLVLFAVLGFLGKGYTDRIDGKLDKVQYERDRVEDQRRLKNMECMLTVIYNAHVPGNMQMPTPTLGH